MKELVKLYHLIMIFHHSMYISDVFGQKSVNLQVFFPIFPYFKVLINIHEYSNKKICISDHVMKGLCLGFYIGKKFYFFGFIDV